MKFITNLIKKFFLNEIVNFLEREKRLCVRVAVVGYELLVIVVVLVEKSNSCLSNIRCSKDQVYLETLFYNIIQNFDSA